MNSESLAVAMELHDDPAAEQQLKEAIAAAKQEHDVQLEGQARAALGIYYQHQGSDEAAYQELMQALPMLPRGADREAAQGHLQSLQHGAPCACSVELTNQAHNVRVYVLERLPEDLISHLGVQISATGAVSINVEVNREPSAEEAELLNQTIDEAISIYGRTTSHSTAA